MTSLTVSKVKKMTDSSYTERFGFAIFKWPGHPVANVLFRTEDEANISQKLVEEALKNSI